MPGRRHYPALRYGKRLGYGFASLPGWSPVAGSPQAKLDPALAAQSAANLSSILLVAVVLTGGTWFLGHANRQTDKARSALLQGKHFLYAGRYTEALSSFHNGLALAEHLPLTGDLVRELHDNAALAERAQGAGELHYSCSASGPGVARASFPPGNGGPRKNCANKFGEIEN